MDSVKIEKIDKLLGAKVVKYKTCNLTAPGENCGSKMLAVEIEQENGEIVQAVAKMLPPNEFLRKMFNCPITFKIELGFYKEIGPAYKKFHEDFSHDQQSLDFFPKFLGGRYNINNDDDQEIDDHACLLLENLKIMGFQAMERSEGFNYEAALLIINDLARFHGIGVALRLKNPQLFEERVRPYINEFKLFDFSSGTGTGTGEKFKEDMMQIVQDVDIISKLKGVFDLAAVYMKNSPKNSKIYEDEPWTTLIHTDLWVNNTMVKLVNGQPVGNKFVDFQMYEYGSPTRDLMFFLFTSINEDVLPHFDELIQYYYNKLIATLSDYGCDIREFSYESFLNSVAKWVKNIELIHSLFMLNSIFMEKENVRDLSEMSVDAMREYRKYPKKHLDRGAFIINKCVEKNWI